MGEKKSVRLISCLSLFLGIAFSPVSAQTEQDIYYKYCVATPDTECFNPVSGAIDTVGRDVGELGGGYRFCLPISDIGMGIRPIRVLLVLDESGSMCYNPGTCCGQGDNTNNCEKNDPNNKRVDASIAFVDTLYAQSPQSQIGVISYSASSDLDLSPTTLSGDAVLNEIYDAIENVGCNNAASPQGLAKTTGVKGTKATNLGDALNRALSAIDIGYDEMPEDMERHIIILTDGAWNDLDKFTPNSLIDAYKEAYPDRKIPTIHGVFISDSATHVQHNYPPQGCASGEIVDLSYFESVTVATGGMYFGGSTPETVVDNFQKILKEIQVPVPSTLDGLLVTNKTNGEVRNHKSIKTLEESVESEIHFEATIDNLPLEFGANKIMVQKTVTKPGEDQPTITIDSVTIFRTEKWTTTVNSEEYNIYCTDDSTSLSIKVSPSMKFINEPFDVQSTIVMKEKFNLDSIDVRVFTGFSDSDEGNISVFHLNGNLDNSVSDNNGTGNDVSYDNEDMLFGNGALSGGTFSSAIDNLEGDFSFETWIYPTSSTSAAELFSIGTFVFGIDGNGKLYVSSGATSLLLSETALGINAWSHVAVSRASGKIMLFINGLSVTDYAAFTDALSGNATVACPSGAMIDELRISSVSRISDEKFGVATRFEIPAVRNITWVHKGDEPTGEVLTLAKEDWTAGSIAFQFKSPVHGKLVVNFQHKGTTLATGWSKNGNPVFAAADIEGPYITRAMITPGPMNSSEDMMKIFFSEPILCDSLKKSTDPAESFKIFGFSGGTPSEKRDVFADARYEIKGCTSGRISDVTLYIKKDASADIAALKDSIILHGSAVDTFGNYPNTDRFAYIESVNSVTINVTPPLLLTNTPYDVTAAFNKKNKAQIENIDVRVFTGFPDSDNSSVAVFHLDNNLINSASDKNGTSSGIDYTSDKMLFGEGALKSGSFSTTISNLSGDFAVESWIRLSSTTTETAIFSAGDFKFGIDSELKLYVSDGESSLAVSEIPIDSNWTHVAVSKLSGKVILSINGLGVSEFADYSGTISGAVKITCPVNGLLDEIRISNAARLIANTPAETMRFEIPSIRNITWTYNNNELTQEALTLPSEEWIDENAALRFSSPVGGTLIVNFQDKGNTPSTIWSRNGNAVYCSADLQGPYITQAVFIPGPINTIEDTVKVHFSEPVICDSLKKNNDLTEIFKVFEFTKGQKPKLKDSVFIGARFVSNICNEERITDVTLLVRTRNVGGIVPLLDSIKLYGSVVDTLGNYPDTTIFGSIIYGPGSGIEIAALPADEATDPMRIPEGVKVRWNITENTGKVIVIQTRAPLVPAGTVIINGEEVKNYSYKAVIYDPVANIVATDLVIKETPQSDRMYFIVWNGTNRSNRNVSTGAYLLKAMVKYKNQLDKFVPLQTKFSIKWFAN